MSTEFEIFQASEYQGDDWWQWQVWLEGSDDDLDHVEFVQWTLHPTFPDPIRKSHDRLHKFQLKTGGWGTFPIRALVQMTDGTTRRLSHYLKLSYPDGKMSPA